MTLLLITSALAAPKWTFDDPKEIAGWTGINQCKISVEKGVLKTESTGTDPYFYPGGAGNKVDWAPFSGAAYTTIYMKLKVNVTNDWQVYYISEEDANWSEGQHQNFTVTTKGADFFDLAVKMESGGWQQHKITRIRIDSGTIVGVIAEIDYISLEGPMAPVNSNGKLPVLWSDLKR